MDRATDMILMAIQMLQLFVLYWTVCTGQFEEKVSVHEGGDEMDQIILKRF